MQRGLKRLYSYLPHEFRQTLLKMVFPEQYIQLQKLQQGTSGGSEAATLRPFVEHKCIFIHIPKTAGVAVNIGLFGSKTGSHRQIDGYRAVFSRREFAQYFKFAFVRNPWDRVASAYFFLKEGGMHEGDQRWAVKHLAPYPTFDAFVHGWLKPENIRLGRHFRPQADYICLPGKRTSELDFIGYYENLRDDYDYVRSVLGTGEELPKKNVTAGKGRDFCSYYTPETRTIVADVYREDIELLGYTFDNSSLPKQLEQRQKKLQHDPPRLEVLLKVAREEP